MMTRTPFGWTQISLAVERCPATQKPTLDQTVRDRIGRDLCGMYGELLRQPIPDRILDLIARLDRTGRATLQ